MSCRNYGAKAALMVMCLTLQYAAGGELDKKTKEPPRWYVYSDAGSKLNHGNWSLYMPDETHGIKLDMTSKEAAWGKTAIHAKVRFGPQGWAGVAVAAQPDNWGETPCRGWDCRRAKRLVFWAKSPTGCRVQFKAGISGAKKYGDSTRLPYETKYVTLTPQWKKYTLTLKGDRERRKRIITPFCFVSSSDENAGAREIEFSLDNIYFELDDETELPKE